MRDKESYLKIKYSVVMPIHKYSKFTDKAIQSVLTAIGDRKDIEFLILDDSKQDLSYVGMIQHVKLQKIDLLNKLIIGTQLAKGEYYCNADYDDISHPQKFELFDKLLKNNDIAGANQCVFWDVRADKTYKMRKTYLTKRTIDHPFRQLTYPWLQHSNSAIPLKWLRNVSYDGGRRLGIVRADGHILTDSPIWVRANIDGLRVGVFADIDPDAWKQCWQIITGDNVNVYSDMNVLFKECNVEKPEVLK